MRVVFATRIFGPEVSAASAILRTLGEEFRDRGWRVEVVTAKPPRGSIIDDPPGLEVRRARVKRDRHDYVRGYLSYLSFDVPLAFRLLFSKRANLYVVEPPPTTVAVVRVVAAIRRTPYVVRAADYWSEAAELVTDSTLVLGMLRRVEAWGLEGAALLLGAHQPLIDRLRQAGITSPAIAIGFGADTRDFRYDGQSPPTPPVFAYAGTHAEWHGAEIFIDALALVAAEYPGARLLFYGNGEDREQMRDQARQLGLEDKVEFHGPIPPAELSPVLAGATATVASLAPVAANEYAVATKVYSSLAAGCPVIFAGIGPTADLLRDVGHPGAGIAVGYSVQEAAAAMLSAAAAPMSPSDRSALAQWSASHLSLSTMSQAVVDACVDVARKP